MVNGWSLQRPGILCSSSLIAGFTLCQQMAAFLHRLSVGKIVDAATAVGVSPTAADDGAPGDKDKGKDKGGADDRSRVW